MTNAVQFKYLKGKEEDFISFFSFLQILLRVAERQKSGEKPFV